MDVRLMELCAKHTKPSEVVGKKIIDVGSYDINGSFRTVLSPMRPESYLGIDLEMGPGVDVVLPIDKLVSVFGKGGFDIVISTEAIEHIADWRGAINTLKDLCKVGGMIYLTSRSKGFPYHGYPDDYWRYEQEDVAMIFANWYIEVLCEDMWRGDHYGFFLKAVKTTHDKICLDDVELYNINTDKRQK